MCKQLCLITSNTYGVNRTFQTTLVEGLANSTSGVAGFGKQGLAQGLASSTPGVAEDIGVGSSSCLDFCNAVSNYSVPVLICERDHMQVNICILAHLHRHLHNQDL